LQLLLKGESFDEEVVQKKMTKYIALMVEDSPEQQERMFEYFLPHTATSASSVVWSCWDG
jgi:hypothetical protein